MDVILYFVLNKVLRHTLMHLVFAGSRWSPIDRRGRVQGVTYGDSARVQQSTSRVRRPPEDLVATFGRMSGLESRLKSAVGGPPMSVGAARKIMLH